MTDSLQQLLQANIDLLPLGAEFDLRTLAGPAWDSISSKQAIGRQFKKAIADGDLRGLVHLRLDNSPRRDIYKRV